MLGETKLLKETDRPGPALSATIQTIPVVCRIANAICAASGPKLNQSRNASPVDGYIAIRATAVTDSAGKIKSHSSCSSGPELILKRRGHQDPVQPVSRSPSDVSMPMLPMLHLETVERIVVLSVITVHDHHKFTSLECPKGFLATKGCQQFANWRKQLVQQASMEDHDIEGQSQVFDKAWTREDRQRMCSDNIKLLFLVNKRTAARHAKHTRMKDLNTTSTFAP